MANFFAQEKENFFLQEERPEEPQPMGKENFFESESQQKVENFFGKKDEKQIPQAPFDVVESLLYTGPDVAVNLITGLAGTVVGGLTGLGTMATNAMGLTDTEPTEVIMGVSGALTIPAQSPAGKAVTKAIAAPFEWWREKASEPVGEAIKPTESPVLAAAAYTTTEVVPFLLLPKVLKGGKELAGKAKHAVAPIKSMVEPIKESFTPMATGSMEARVAAKNYVNSVRQSDTLRNEVIQKMEKKFNKEDMTAIADAAIAQELAVARGATTTEALDVLNFNQRQALQMLMDRHKSVAEAAIEAGILKKHNDSYFPRKVVESLDEAAIGRIEQASGMRLRTTTPHAKKRKHETTAETAAAATEALGKEMKVVNDVRVIPLVTAELEKAIAGKQLVNEIRTHSKKLGADAVVNGERSGYFHIDHPSMFEWTPRIEKRDGKWVNPKDDLGKPIFDRTPIYVHESFRNPLNAVLKNESGKIATAFMQLKAKSMSMIMFNPLMHGMVIWGKALPFQPYRTLTFRNYADGRRIYNGAESEFWIKHATSHGMAPIGNQGWMQRMNDIMQTPQLTAGKSWTAKVAGTLAKPLGKQEFAMRAVDKAGHFWHDTLLWEPIRHAQMGMYKNLYEGFVKKGVEAEAAGHLAGHISNRFAGSVPFEDMGHGVRAAANFMLFSRTFNATNVGIYKDAVKGLPQAVQDQILQTASKLDLKVGNSKLKRAATATLFKDIAAMYVLNSLMQNVFDYMKSGDAGEIAKEYAENTETYSKKVEENPMNAFFELKQLPAQSLNEPGKEHRIAMGRDPYGTMTYLRNPIGKIGEDLEKIATSPLAMATDKLSPTMKFIAGVATNDKSINKGYGIEVYNKKGSLKDAPENVGNILKFFVESHTPSGFIESTIDAITGEDPSGIQKKKMIGQLAGFSVSKGAPGGPAAGIIYDTIDKHKREIQEHMPDIVKQLRMGNNEKAVDLMINKAGMSEKDIRRTLKKIHPTINEKMVADFLLIAEPAEKKKLERLFKKYYGVGK